AKEMPGTDITWIDRENLAVNLLRLVQAARLLMTNGSCDGFSNGRQVNNISLEWIDKKTGTKSDPGYCEFGTKGGQECRPRGASPRLKRARAPFTPSPTALITPS